MRRWPLSWRNDYDGRFVVYNLPSDSDGCLLLDPLRGGEHGQLLGGGAGGQQVEQHGADVCRDQALSGVQPCSHVSQHRGHLDIEIVCS